MRLVSAAIGAIKEKKDALSKIILSPQGRHVCVLSFNMVRYIKYAV